MGKHKRKRKDVSAFGVMTEEGLQSLEKIRVFVSTAEGLVASLHGLMRNYQAMQADGGLQRLISMVSNTDHSSEDSDGS